MVICDTCGTADDRNFTVGHTGRALPATAPPRTPRAHVIVPPRTEGADRG